VSIVGVSYSYMKSKQHVEDTYIYMITEIFRFGLASTWGDNKVFFLGFLRNLILILFFLFLYYLFIDLVLNLDHR
jgi:hypothetical protein